jgi:hypothetical protein
MSCGITLSRFTAETYQDLMDAWTTVCGIISATYGHYRTEIIINAAKVKSPGASDDNIAKEVLEIIPFYTETNNFANWLAGNTLVHNSPIMLRVRDTSSVNSMFAN